MTPDFFVGLADSYRKFRDYRGPNIVILWHDNTPEEWALLQHVAPQLRGPARWLAKHKPGGWDDVDIAHVVRAAYELYRDPRLNIGDYPHHGYVGGKWVGPDDSGESYGRFDQWLWSAPPE